MIERQRMRVEKPGSANNSLAKGKKKLWKEDHKMLKAKA